MVFGHHIVLLGYGHWLPNDPRGSYSREVFSPDLQPLAEAHFGRRRTLPTREEMRSFFRESQHRLRYPTLWWDEPQRRALCEAFGGVVREKDLTCYAAAVLQNHVHLLIRKQKVAVEVMWDWFVAAGRMAMVDGFFATTDHPVFSEGGCRRFKSSEKEMWGCVEYIEGNFRKHRLAYQRYPFVTEYDGWPTRRGRGGADT